MSDAVIGQGWTSAVHDPDLQDAERRRPEYPAPQPLRPRRPNVDDGWGSETGRRDSGLECHTRLIEVRG